MAFSPETYALCLKNTAEKIDEALTSVYNYKGSVDTIADLPLTNNKVGDTYDVKSEGGQNYGWNGESWDSLGVNREATDTDLGLIKKKDNTFNTTTFVGDMTAINSNNTSITGSGITSINGEGSFEVSKRSTVLASIATHIAGSTVTISPSSSINLTAARINLVTTGSANEGIIINADDMPILLKGKLTISGYNTNTTNINTPVICSQSMEVQSLTAKRDIHTQEYLSANGNIYGKNYGSSRNTSFNSLIKEEGARDNIILGEGNTYIKHQGQPAQNIENIIIGNSNQISDEAANDFIIGKSNIIESKCSTALGLSNYIAEQADYSLIKGQANNIQALGATIFGFKNNSTDSAEFSLVSGVSSTVNGKTSTVLGDNLIGSTETGSMTIGTFNEKKDAMFVVGNGNQSSSSVITRSNAFEVYKNGDAVIQNNLIVGTTISLGRTVGTEIGSNSTALGSSVEASGNYSHAEGWNTTASGESSHAEGYGTTASGRFSHTEGGSTKAFGEYSHAGGLDTLTRYKNQTAIGCLNNNKENNLFEIGNGSTIQNPDDKDNPIISRNNAFEVDKDGNTTIQNNLTVGGTINASSLKNIPVWTLDDIQESDEPVNIFKYFLGDGYNDFTTCNRWFIVMPQTPRQFFIGHKSKQGVTLNLSSLGEMHLLYFIKTSEKWTITLYNITGKLNESSTKSIPTIEVRSFVEDESGNFSVLTTIPTFVTSVSGMMDADYNPSSDRHIITMKYLNTRIQELLDNEISSKITEELNKINVAENKN